MKYNASMSPLEIRVFIFFPLIRVFIHSAFMATHFALNELNHHISVRECQYRVTMIGLGHALAARQNNVRDTNYGELRMSCIVGGPE